MPAKEFCHLHFHTEYSLLDGACRVKDAVARAAELEMPALAITDHGVLHGAVEFYKACKAKGIKPIIGCEVYVSQGDMHEKTKNEDGSQANHLLLLARNETGYRNLSKLVSLGHLEGFYYKPRIDRETLSQYSDGLIGTSGCLKGEVPELVLKGRLDAAIERTGQYQEIFGRDNYFMELMDHGLSEQHQANHGVLEISRRLDIPLIATNDVHYIHHSDYDAHDVMLCLQTQTVMSDPNRLRYHADQFYMKTAEEMHELFRDHPEALTNTLRIAEMCDLTLKLGATKAEDLHFPKFSCPDGHDAIGYLRHLVEAGIRERYGVEDLAHPKNDHERVVKERYEKEIGVIIKTGFIDYFLVVWDFIRYAHSRHIPVGPGRGSGAGSLVAFVLGITAIDPLEYGLIFERFLNPERISPPDFDIDFCQYRRGEVIEYVKEKYGHENCAQIITFGTLGAKLVLRDVGRALEIPLGECDKLAKMVPEDPGMTLEKALKANPEFKQACETNENARRIMKYARVLEGLPRNQGTHAAGVVIGEKPLIDIIPLCRDKEKQTITQFEMKPLEQTGMLKMDFLGLKTLTVIQEAVDNVRETQSVELDMPNLPFEDDATFELLNRGDTVGVFQVESRGMRDLLRDFQLRTFRDLIALIAMYRPGPMEMIPELVARRHGKVKIRYDHPLLEPILDETYGVMVYQEQVQQAAFSLAGYSLGEGDILRRAMGKKDPQIMAGEREKFVAGCLDKNNIDARLAGKIFDTMEQFAGYGFNKSHSTAYGVLSWQTAYLKANFPIEFMAALCSCDMGNPDKLAFFIAECRGMGIEVHPPSVNAGGARFKPDGDAIRFGMAGIKNVGQGAVDALVAERKRNGPYESLTDFCTRLDGTVVNKKVLESLVQCGAFDFTGLVRSRLFSGIEMVMSRASADQADRLAGQTSLFDMLEPDQNAPSAALDDLPEVDPWPESEMLKNEKELLGFYISGHPLEEFEWHLKHLALHRFEDLAGLGPRAPVRIGGMISGVRKLYTRRTQEAMAAFQLSGLDASWEAVMFPSAYAVCGAAIGDDEPVMVAAEIAPDEENKLIINEAYPLREAGRMFATRLVLHLPADLEEAPMQRIKEILRAHPGQVAVVCCIATGGRQAFIGTDPRLNVEPNPELCTAIEEVLGSGRVEVAALKRAGKREKKQFRRAG